MARSTSLRRARALPFVLALTPLLAELEPARADEEEPEPFAELAWRDIGPAVFSGRITDIELLPGEPHGFLVAGASGGLFRTRNNGTTWECIFQHEGTTSIGDVAVDPGDADVIWVGTGEGNNQRSSYWGDGIYKTTDGGETWTNTGLPESHHVGRIVIDPRDSKVVYVAALGHLYTSNPERGLYKTSDGGESWELSLFVSDAVGVVDVVLDPANPDVVYAASYERLRRAWHFDGAGPGSGIWKSTDAGATWARLEGGLPEGEIGRIGLCVSPKAPHVLFATVSNQNQRPPEPSAPKDLLGFWGEFEEGGLRIASVDERRPAADLGLKQGDLVVKLDGAAPTSLWALIGALADRSYGDEIEIVYEREGEETTVTLSLEPRRRGRTFGGEIYRSDDAGETWAKQNEDPVGGSPPYYYGQIRIDPQDPDRLYVLSVPLYWSDDGGKKWESNLAGSVHVDHHALVVDPENPRRLILGNDGGLAISYDRGETWDHYPNLPIAQFYAVGVDQRRPYHVYGGTQDNGTWGGPSRSRDRRGIGAGEWYSVGGGDGFYAQIDPRDPDTVYGESQFGAVYRRDLATGARASIRPPRTDPEGEPDRYNWNSPILISHHNPEIVYFAGNKLFKSFNRGDSWPIVSPDLTTAAAEKIEGNVPHCTITTVAESPLDPSFLLVGTDDGLVQRSTDGGLSWTNLTGRLPGAPANWWISRVELSRHEADTAYVSITGYREDDFRPLLFVTTDRGETWRAIAGDLPQEPINVVREDPANPHVLYVGTELGVYVTLDGGEHWHRLGSGLPTIAVHDLVVHARDRELVIATHGRGFWVVDVAPFAALTPEEQAKPAHLAPVVDVLLLGFGRTGSNQGQRLWRGENPPSGAAIWYHLTEEQEKDAISLTVQDAAGKQVAELKPEREPGLYVARWDLRRRAERGGDGDGDDSGGGRRGRGRRVSRAEPGKYIAVLEVGEERFERPFELLPDPRSSGGR